jgi:hypothetical protein
MNSATGREEGGELHFLGWVGLGVIEGWWNGWFGLLGVK